MTFVRVYVFMCLTLVISFCTSDENPHIIDQPSTSSSEESSKDNDVYQDSSGVGWQEDWHDQAQELIREADEITKGLPKMKEEADVLSFQAEQKKYWANENPSHRRDEAHHEAEKLLVQADDMRRKADEEEKRANELRHEADVMMEKVRTGRLHRSSIGD